MSTHNTPSEDAALGSVEHRSSQNGSGRSNLDMTVFALVVGLIMFGTLALVAVTSSGHTAGAGGVTTTPTPSGKEGGAGVSPSASSGQALPEVWGCLPILTTSALVAEGGAGDLPCRGIGVSLITHYYHKGS
jgi:hypothetical protein